MVKRWKKRDKCGKVESVETDRNRKYYGKFDLSIGVAERGGAKSAEKGRISPQKFFPRLVKVEHCVL